MSAALRSSLQFPLGSAPIIRAHTVCCPDPRRLALRNFSSDLGGGLTAAHPVAQMRRERVLYSSSYWRIEKCDHVWDSERRPDCLSHPWSSRISWACLPCGQVFHGRNSIPTSVGVADPPFGSLRKLKHNETSTFCYPQQSNS